MNRRAPTDQARRSGSDTRERILATAAGLFRAEGYAAVSMRAIAGAANLQPASLYYHFKLKDQIVTEVLDIGVQRVFDAVRTATQALPQEAGLEHTLRTAIQTHLVALLHAHDFTSANIRIFGQVPDTVRRAHRTLRRRYERFWCEMLATFQARGEINAQVDVQRTVFFLFGAMNWSAEWYEPKRANIEEIANELATLAINGLVSHTTGTNRAGANRAASKQAAKHGKT